MAYQSVFKPDLFKGQTIIVTGGGSGIGRCAAHELTALGANVAILGRTIEKLTEVQREIEEDGGQAMIQPCDIRDETMVIAAIEAVLAKYGRIDGLINNAGGQFRAPLKSISTKGFEAVVQQPDRRLHLHARGLYPLDASQWRRDREHHRRHLARLA